MSEQDEAAALAASLIENELSECCVHDNSAAYLNKYECFPADWTGAKRVDSCFVNVLADALRAAEAKGRAADEAEITLLRKERADLQMAIIENAARYAAAKAEATREALERACKAICGPCADGWEVQCGRAVPPDLWYHPTQADRGAQVCQAGPIRALIPPPPSEEKR